MGSSEMGRIWDVGSDGALGLVQRPARGSRGGASSGHNLLVSTVPVRCYILCAVPRTGSWLLSHALEATGLAGSPSEYFWRDDEPFWRKQWDVDSYRDYLSAFQGTATANGVAGTKMTWGYFSEFLDKVRQLPEMAQAPHEELMQATFPELRHLWIRRRDKVRQGISWWRAEVTGEWARFCGQAPQQRCPESLDLAAVKNLVHVALAHDKAWANYFRSHSIEPWSVYYEDLINDVDAYLNAALEHLGVHPGTRVHSAPARIERHADQRTEQWVEEYLEAEDAGRLEDVASVAQVAVPEDGSSRAARQSTAPKIVEQRVEPVLGPDDGRRRWLQGHGLTVLGPRR